MCTRFRQRHRNPAFSFCARKTFSVHQDEPRARHVLTTCLWLVSPVFFVYVSSNSPTCRSCSSRMLWEVLEVVLLGVEIGWLRSSVSMVRSDQVPISPTRSWKLIGFLPAGQRAGANGSFSHYQGQAGNRHQPSSHHSPPLERPLATSALLAPTHRAARLLELPLQPLWSMILLQTVHI